MLAHDLSRDPNPFLKLQRILTSLLFNNILRINLVDKDMSKSKKNGIASKSKRLVRFIHFRTVIPISITLRKYFPVSCKDISPFITK